MFLRFRTIWDLAKGQRVRYLAAIAALVVASCFLYLAPMIPQVVIDGVIIDEGGDSAIVRTLLSLMGGREFVAANYWWPALLIVVLTAIAGVFTYLRGRWSAQASEAIARSVRDRVYDHLQHLPCSFFDTAKTGDLIQRCTSDVETLRVFLSTQVVEIGRAMIMLLIPIPVMLAIDVRMTVLSVALIPPIVIFSLIFFSKVRERFKATDEAEGRMTTTIQENLTGIRVVRAFARQEFECEKFAVRNEQHRDLDYRLYVLLARFWSCSDLLCFIQKALVMGAGIYWMAIGELTVGAFFYFITATTMFIWPVRMMGRILTDLGKAVVALGRLQEILEEAEESAADVSGDADDAGRLDGHEQEAGIRADRGGEIVFDHVSFSHGEESPVLDDVSFRLEAGRTLAVLGPSGCGKSTVVNLLLRLYDADAGSILLDQRSLSDIERKEAREEFAVVMQEPFLYSKSLRENITISHPGAGEEEMIEATTTACVHESILTFDDGYDTRVGERGVTLSGGQRQRVALARALLRDPTVLILDDALSAVDADTETMIIDALRRRRGRHSTIVIAHRLSTLMHADHAIVLDHGRVVQSGSHQQLLEVDGLYRRLWAIQTAVESTEEQDGRTSGTSASAERSI